MYYKLLKEKGKNLSLVLENVTTHAQLNLGNLSIDILKLLEKTEGLTFGIGGKIQLEDAWNIHISEDTAKELSKKAMQISKPIRNKTEEEPKKSNKEIDALDVLLGLANYN